MLEVLARKLPLTGKSIPNKINRFFFKACHEKKIVVVFYRNLSETKERVHHRHLKLQRISSKPKSDKFLQ